jgi:hypothetical protein
LRFRKIEHAIPRNRTLAGAETPSGASSLAATRRSSGASSRAGAARRDHS